jgi:single-strand DNA-binding protein
MDLNQISIIGYLGSDAKTSSTAGGTQVTKFSVATNKSWKDDNTGEWKSKSQWHNVVGYGDWPASLASRLIKGAHVFVQGELITREYERTVEVTAGKKNVEAKVMQLAVEIRPDRISLLDRKPDSESASEGDQNG